MCTRARVARHETACLSAARVMLQVFEQMVACGNGVGPGCVVWAGGGGCGSDVLARDYLERFWLPCPLLRGSRHRSRPRVLRRLPGTPGGALPEMLGDRRVRVVIGRRGRVRRLGGLFPVSPTSLPVNGPSSTSRPPPPLPVGAVSPVSPPPPPPGRSRRSAQHRVSGPHRVRVPLLGRVRLLVVGLRDRVVVGVVMVVVVGCGMLILVWC